MNTLERKVKRLEQRMGVKPGPRMIYLTPNLEDADGEETPYQFRISSGVWASVFGEPLTDEEIHKLREEHNEERNQNEPETED